MPSVAATSDTPAPSPATPLRRLVALARRVARPTIHDLLLLVPVVVALVTVVTAYAGTAVPPGPDSGHWVTTAYAYVGHPHPSDFTVQPLAYPPVTFLLVGAAFLATQSPVEAARLSVALLLVIYGLTTIHVARRFLGSRPGQLLFVGIAVLNGPTLQMLFWGGFPNFLGFALMNEGMVCLLAFLLRRGLWEGLAFWGAASLLYLTHDLSFDLFAAAVALFAAVWLVDRGWSALDLLKARGMRYGIGLFVAALALNQLLGTLLGVRHPSYLYSNPASFELEPLGLLFRIFHYAPAVFPQGPLVILTSGGVLALLLAMFGVLAVAVGGIVWTHPGRLPPTFLIASAWLGATFLGPAVGYVIHIDTDYPRFAYFFAVPAALFSVGAAELGIPWLQARRRVRLESTGAGRPPGARPRNIGTRPVEQYAAVGLVLGLIFFSATLPSAIRGQTSFAISSHDEAFQQAAHWIATQPGPGSVVTEAYAARWTEALTARTAYASGASWIHYYPQQIINDELTFWALTAHYVATDNHAALAYTGYNSSSTDAFPEYVGFDQGVAIPMVRIAESTLSVAYRLPNGTAVNDLYSTAWGDPVFTLSAGAPLLTATFHEPAFRLTETATLDGNGTATIALLVLPAPSVNLTRVAFQLAAPIPSTIARTVPYFGLNYAGNGSANFTWSVQGPLGPLPGVLRTSVGGSFSRNPDGVGSFQTPAVQPTRITFAFPTSATGFSVQLRIGGPAWSNPAVTLPPTIDSRAFLDANQVRFLLVENISTEATAAQLFADEYGFALAYENPEWMVWER